MVLPGTHVTALFLLCLAILCFGAWPSIFKLTNPQWKFELFSMDFGIGAVVLSLLAAYTFGSRGSDLGFSDNMLVAGQRAEAFAVLGGMAFALGNLSFMGCIALIGIVNASLLTFSALGCVIACLYLQPSSYITSILALAILIFATALEAIAASGGKPAAVKAVPARAGSSRKGGTRKPISISTKGIIVGILAGLSFAGVFPLLRLSQPEQLGIGAYGGVLLASIGILVATICLNFFFLNISLEGSKVGYGSYISGAIKDHVPGVVAGAVCALGALALYAAYTGSAPITLRQAWIVPFAGGLLSVILGLGFGQQLKSKNMVFAATGAFVLGVGALLVGLR